MTPRSTLTTAAPECPEAKESIAFVASCALCRRLQFNPEVGEVATSWLDGVARSGLHELKAPAGGVAEELYRRRAELRKWAASFCEPHQVEWAAALLRADA